MKHREITSKVNDLSGELYYLTKDDFFQDSEASPLTNTLKAFLENVSFTLDKFAEGIEAESGDEE